ncbi:MAG: pseudouridine synthase [Bacteroidales bacterium]
MERSSKKREVKRETRTNAQEEPAKVYRPRTMAPKSINPDTESDTPKPRFNDSEEPTKKPSFSSKEKSFDKPRKPRRDDEQDGASGYKPRTLKRRNADEVPFRSRFAPDNRADSSDENESDERFPSKSKRFEDNEERSNRKPRFDSRSNNDTRERNSRSGSRTSRFEKSDDRKERGDRFSTKPKRSEESDNTSGYKSRTFKKKNNDEFTQESKPRKDFSKTANSEREDDGLIRLNKYIANSGLCSRREADELIQGGMISVNGEVITVLGSRVNPNDEICYKGKTLESERKVYILLNKPKDYVTTVEDPHAKRTVMELLDGACDERIYPVGRLDRNSTGVLLLTNDGEMTKKLTHPSFMKKKIYYVELDKKVSFEDMEKIRAGVEVDGEILTVDAVDYTEESDGTEVGVEIHTGQNRVVRRIFESLFYRVVKLDRVYFAGLTKKNLPRGKWRFLTQKEVNALKMNRF